MPSDITTLGISLALGLLIGLQRQRSDTSLGGIRTFPLVSLLGTICGFLASTQGPWVLAAGFLSIVALIVVSNLLKVREGDVEPGQTSEVAALVTFALGAYLVQGQLPVALVAAGIAVVLLHMKQPMHLFVSKMGPQDMAALMQFVVISLIILPILPDRGYGPWAVLNPFDIWRMVVLIVAISLAGYIAYKFFGQQAGALLGGILGGLISSTATTVAYARRTRNAPQASRLAVIVILVASAVAYLRVILEIVVVAPGHAAKMVPPIAAMLLWVAVISAAAFLFRNSEKGEIPAPSNPAELKGAIIFGAIYAVILLAVAGARELFGSTALYTVAVISGLTDMDAITLSVSRMTSKGEVQPDTAWRLVLVASLANFLFKGLIASFIGGRALALRLAMFFLAGIAGGGAILIGWNFLLDLLL